MHKEKKKEKFVFILKMNNKMALICMLLSFNCFGATYLSNHDGDTLKVQENGVIKTLRLAFIDAQELKQSFGYHAKNLTQDTCKNANISYVSSGKISYNRIVAEVYCDNVNIGKLLLANGVAKLDDRYPTNDINYKEIQAMAKNQTLRVWSGNYTEPKLFIKYKELFN